MYYFDLFSLAKTKNKASSSSKCLIENGRVVIDLKITVFKPLRN
jgi:uncharacterized protein YjhX (UPF0386 family)